MATHSLRVVSDRAAPLLPPLLQIDGVSLEYRTPERIVRATHQVSFDVHAGDRFVLLGPSGCGKSTLLKAVAGFVAPAEGEIRLEGQRVQQPGRQPALNDQAAEPGAGGERFVVVQRVVVS